MSNYSICFSPTGGTKKVTDILGNAMPFEAGWTPDPEDTHKWAELKLSEKKKLHSVVLYDDPDLENNILSLEIELDEGDVVYVGPLMPNGSATAIELDGRESTCVSVRIKDWEGKAPSLTEIELYESEKKEEFPIIKLMSTDGDFVYDYLSAEERITLDIYARGIGQFSDEDFELNWDNEQCSLVIEDGQLTVSCPEGQQCIIEIRHAESGEEDRIRVYCMSPAEKLWRAFTKTIYDKYTACLDQQISRIWRVVSDSPLGAVTAIVRMNLMNIG